MKVLEHTPLKKMVEQIIKDDAKAGLIVGSLMVSMVHYAFKIGWKSFMLTDENVLCELAETIRIGSNITPEEAQTMLYAIIGWFICQKEKEVQLQDGDRRTVGIFEIENGSIEFKVRDSNS